MTSHSLRIGAATAAGKKGLPDYLLRAAGRWRSSAFQRYVRLASPDLKVVAKAISE